MRKNDITIVVNSCDKYSDLWYPFFELLRIQWPDLSYPIILNTESKTYVHPQKVGGGITCLQLFDHDEQVDWSTRFLKTLEHVKTKYVLAFLDDEFIQKPVDTKEFEKLLKLLKRDPFIPYISISSCFNGMFRNATKSKLYANLDVLSVSFYSFHSANAALWRTKRLKKYLLPGESPWEFEVNCKGRSGILERHYLVRDGFSPICVSYSAFVGIGIWKGKWMEKTPELFRQYGIEVDYEKRGFVGVAKLDEDTNQLEVPLRKRIKGYIDFLKEYKMPKIFHKISLKIKGLFKRKKH